MIRWTKLLPVVLALLLLTVPAQRAAAADVFVRVKVEQPAGERFFIVFGGHRHAGEPWFFTESSTAAAGGAWSDWVDLSAWPWHGKVRRAGGVAEWPSMKIRIKRIARAGGAGGADGGDSAIAGCTIAVELADAPDEAAVVHRFSESSESATIGFLVPTPLREQAAEFETGSQMVARHLRWAQEVTGGTPIELKQFEFCTALWGPYDPGLARQSLAALRQLGFNVIRGTNETLIRAAGARPYRSSWIYLPDPEAIEKEWTPTARQLAETLKTDAGQTQLEALAHWVISDEIRTLDVSGVEENRRDGWFREYLRRHGVGDEELGWPIDQVRYPVGLLKRKALPREAPLTERRLAYHAAKFGHWWSARRLAQCSDLVRASLPWVKTEALPSDHGFFNAWGPPHVGMSAPMLDLFELAAQRAVDQLSAEDWLGLNHMYGPAHTWTGAQSFAYFNAVMRSAIGDRPIMLRSLITPSDDRYLRLKACSALGQGSKSLFFWTFGPTYVGTENYWSDLRSEYEGIARLGRALERAETILHPARPVSDPVAVLYSVSHDLWHSDNPAAFVEKRLLWHALRHLHVQPDFLREEDVAGGALQNYKALYLTDWCVSRAASAEIDRWVRDGGVVYLSAGAATRDEFYQPHVPPFARGLWPNDAAEALVIENHEYNERVDLPTIAPLDRVGGRAGGIDFDLPAIGCRLNLRDGVAEPLARFHASGAPAAAVTKHGKGSVVAVGFMPMLAYGQLANFKPTTLEEKWPPEPRLLPGLALALAKVTPAAAASEPVVETSLLTGPEGSVLVLANYTYQPITSLKLRLRLSHPVGEVTSAVGSEMNVRPHDDGVTLELPLRWTDFILLPRS